MFRAAATAILAAFFLICEPRFDTCSVSLGTPAVAEESSGPDLMRYLGAGAQLWTGELTQWLAERTFHLGDLLTPPTINGCSLLVFCKRNFRGLSRFTRLVTRTTSRTLRTTARATTRVARVAVRTTTRVAKGAARTTVGVAAGAASVAVGAAGGALGAIAPRRRGQVEFAVRGLRQADLDRLARRGYVVVQRRDSSLLGGQVSRLRAPTGMSRLQARSIVEEASPGITVADNDLFRRPNPKDLYRAAGRSCGKRCENFDVTEWVKQASNCSEGAKIGVIDTGVDITHPSLADARITVMTARSPDLPESDMDHGTAVVSLLVGQPGSGIDGLVPRSHVFAVDAFHGKGDAVGADVYDVITALDWLAFEGVKVVNLSLSGPENALLQEAIARMQETGTVVVAASGRPGGSNDNTGFPGKYPGVVAVSAVDNRLRPSRLALRGNHITFTAPGVGLAVAHAGDKVQMVDGTSFAAPFVTAAYAMATARMANAGEVTARLAQSAKDLGAPGRDPVYGWGLVQFSSLPRCD